MTAKITVVGSLNMDLVASVRRIPNPGETVIGGDLRTIPGGNGANQAVAAARLGGRVSMVGRVGSDLFAGKMIDNLKAAGIDASHVARDEHASSGVAMIAVDMVGQNSAVVSPGANAKLSPADVEAARELIQSAKVLLLQLEVPLETVCAAARIAKEGDALVILNPSPAQLLTDELLALVDVIIPNENETALLTNRSCDTQRELKQAAAHLLKTGVGSVIMTLGEEGALLAQPAGLTLFPAFTPRNVIDTTAAGDAFVGGFAAALAEGRPIEEAVVWGNAAGCLAVGKMGAQNSLPDRAELGAQLAGGSPEQLRGVKSGG